MLWPIKRFGCLAVCAALLLGGCGFRPGSEARLPPQMHSTFIASDQPYGELENLLRRALARRGITVAEDRSKASAVLQIMSTTEVRRVLAVNANGTPAEYAIRYEVRFQLLDARGTVLLEPQSLQFSREYAYSPAIELGATREQSEVLLEIRQDATRMILFRLEGLARAGSKP